MKKYFLFFALIQFLSYSCNEEGISEQGISSSERAGLRELAFFAYENEQEFKEFVHCYDDLATAAKQKSFTEKYGRAAELKIHYKNNKAEAQIYPLLKNDTIKTILWFGSGNDGAYIKKGTHLSESDVSNTNLTGGIMRVFNLLESDLKVVTPKSIIDLKLGDGFITYKEGDLLVIEEIGDFNTLVTPTTESKTEDICNYNELADLYFIIFGFHDESGTLPNYVFEKQIMIDVINQIVPHNGFCYCPRQCLVLQALNERDDVMESAKEQANKSWVGLSYGLDLLLLDGAEAELINDLVYFDCSPKNVIDACTNQRIQKSTISNSLLNSSLPYTSGGFYNVLGGDTDFIVKKHFEYCSKMGCVLDKILDIGLCSEIASSFQELEGSFDLIYQYDYNCMSHPILSNDLGYGLNCEFSGEQSDYASTRPSPGCFMDEFNNQVCEPFTIQLYNKHFCTNLNPLEMAAYYLHETMHSEFHRWVYDGVSGNIISHSQFSADGLLWSAIVLKKYGSDDITNHHALMNEYFVPEMTEILWLLNGETDEDRKEYYKYFVYDLLLSDDLLISKGYLTQSELDNLKNLSSQIMSNVGCE